MTFDVGLAFAAALFITGLIGVLWFVLDAAGRRLDR